MSSNNSHNSNGAIIPDQSVAVFDVRKQSSLSIDSQKQPKLPTKYQNSHCEPLNLRTKIFYSFGHVYNDLCASIWFSYTLLYFKLSFDDSNAGLLLLLGQIADALATPFIGYWSDKRIGALARYGRRKGWHLIGTVFVTISFPLIFHSCVWCGDAPLLPKFVYYSVCIVVFQFGWAAVQVAHLSLITDLTDSLEQRVELNAYRQAATVASSICLYSITLALLGVEDSTITNDDSIVFMKVVQLITVIGIVFTLSFHIFVNEPNKKFDGELNQIEIHIVERNVNEKTNSSLSTDGNSTTEISVITKSKISLLESGLDVPTRNRSAEEIEQSNRSIRITTTHYVWSDWLKCGNFWRICIVYMMSRLYVNVTQVYTPLYLQETLKLAKRNIAIVPFITYFAGFIFSFVCKWRQINSKTIFYGCFFSLISCIWIWYCSLAISLSEIYAIAAVFGIGGTFMLIGSLSLTADLIGDNKISGAFVYGSMSFFDKLINGMAIALVQHLKPISSSLHLTPMIIVNETTRAATTNILIPDDYWSNLNDQFGQSATPTAIAPTSQIDTLFYLYVLSFVSGAAVIVTFVTLCVVVMWRKQNLRNFVFA